VQKFQRICTLFLYQEFPQTPHVAGQSVAHYQVPNDDEDEAKVQHSNCGERNVGNASNDDMRTSNGK
jgi:hypothetical protein